MCTLGIVNINVQANHVLTQFANSYGYKPISLTDYNNLNKVDMLIIDASEKYDFSTICQWLLAVQEKTTTFVWILITEISEKDRQLCLQLGANSVIERKHGLNELFLLIKNTIKRFELQKLSLKENESAGPVVLNEMNLSVLINGRETFLTRSEYQVMTILYRNVGQSVTYEEFTELLWGNIENNLRYRVSNIIFHLRKKLEMNGEKIILSVRSKGYRLVI